MIAWLRTLFSGRSGWMNGLMVFCAYMTFVYLPWDLLIKPVAQDQEVWFGILFTGWAAKVLAIPHWIVYGVGAYGFYHMRSWMWPWAALYVAQIAFGMLVWSLVYGPEGFTGVVAGLVPFAVFSYLTLALWRAEPRFGGSRPPLRDRYGEWALVTGASAGIGADFARALAREGVCCVLSARREERLAELAAELEQRYGVRTRVVAADLSQPGEAERLAEQLADLEIGMLVNNAGVGYAGRFHKLDSDRLRDMVVLNCVSPVVLTSRLLPAMRERGRGAVVVTGSIAGRQPLPLHSVYAATKAFDLLFGEALSLELRGDGIDVVVLEPGATATEFQQAAGESGHPGESAAAVVAVALDALGRQPSVISGWLNWLQVNLANRLLPRPLVAHIAHQVVAAQTPEEMR
jgi:short-subunit dehydrogenase